MISILKKEFNSFFASPIAYLVIAVFLVVTGLFLWVFKDTYNILSAGFADINPFFYLAPWLFLFLVPAITMKSFADEFSIGTIEILKTKPITDWQIVLGKFFAAVVLGIIAILPSLLYVYSIYQLALPVGNIDFGSIFGSYLGLILIIAAYTSVGLFTSTLSKNQIVSFVLAIFITFLLYHGFDALGDLFGAYRIKNLGISAHYKSISRGVVDSRDVVYFLSVTFLFLFITKTQLNNNQ